MFEVVAALGNRKEMRSLGVYGTIVADGALLVHPQLGGRGTSLANFIVSGGLNPIEFVQAASPYCH